MLYKIAIQKQIDLPINKTNHEVLVPVCRKLIAEHEFIQQIYLHHNTLYLLVDLDAPSFEVDLMTLSVTLGGALHRYFRHTVTVEVTACGQVTFSAASRIEQGNAELLYEAYVESLTTDCTSDLFGADAIVPFEKLPEYFRLGTYFKGKAYGRVAKSIPTGQPDIIKQIFDEIYKPPQNSKIMPIPTMGSYPTYIACKDNE